MTNNIAKRLKELSQTMDLLTKNNLRSFLYIHENIVHISEVLILPKRDIQNLVYINKKLQTSLVHISFNKQNFITQLGKSNFYKIAPDALSAVRLIRAISLPSKPELTPTQIKLRKKFFSFIEAEEKLDFTGARIFDEILNLLKSMTQSNYTLPESLWSQLLLVLNSRENLTLEQCYYLHEALEQGGFSLNIIRSDYHRQ